MYFLDTDTISNCLKKNPSPALLRRLAEIPGDQQYTSAITVGELVYGAYRSDRPEYFLRQLEERVVYTVLDDKRVSAFEPGYVIFVLNPILLADSFRQGLKHALVPQEDCFDFSEFTFDTGETFVSTGSKLRKLA